MMSRGLSLLETVLALVVVGVVSASVAPLVSAMTDTTRDAMATRDAADQAAFALDRVVRLLRETPVGDEGGVGIVAAEAQHMTLSDGRSIALLGSELVLTDALGRSGVLCQNVQEFELTYLGGDGVTDTSATPEQTRRVVVRLAVGGLTLAGCACPRVTLTELD